LGSFIENESVDELIMRNLCHNYELAIIDSIMLSNKHQIFPVIKQHILKSYSSYTRKFAAKMKDFEGKDFMNYVEANHISNIFITKQK